jgi:hypothetical protein
MEDLSGGRGCYCQQTHAPIKEIRESQTPDQIKVEDDDVLKVQERNWEYESPFGGFDDKE